MGEYHLAASHGGPAGKDLDVEGAKVSHCAPRRCEKVISFLSSLRLLYFRKQCRLGDNA